VRFDQLHYRIGCDRRKHFAQKKVVVAKFIVWLLIARQFLAAIVVIGVASWRGNAVESSAEHAFLITALIAARIDFEDQ
jgi:hypothetical protein